MGRPKRDFIIFLSAGEPSGDLHGARLVRELKVLLPNARFIGLGGPKMASQGVEILIPPGELAIVGFQEVILRLRKIHDMLKLLVRKAASKADLAIFIDYPGFNLQLARYFHRAGKKTVYYIVPQVWAWGTWRAVLLRKYIDKALVILPFEEPFLRNKGVDAEYIGHPLLDIIDEDTDRLEIEKSGPVIAFLPGSRPDEIRRLLPKFLAIRDSLRKKLPGCLFLVSLLHSNGAAEKIEAPDTLIYKGRARAILRACDYAIVASGTVSLEAGLLEKPMTVLYMLSELSWLLARKLAKVKYASLVNILLGRKVVNEYIQHIDPEKIASEVFNVLNSPEQYNSLQRELSKLRQILGEKGATRKAAERIVKLLYS